MGWLYAAVALLLLAPLDIAHACYDAARAAPARAASWMAVAAELDPEMPLYRARLGWLAPDAARRRLELERAAAGAPGVAALQLAAGWASRISAAPGDSGGEAHLEAACNADPLAGTAPFLLAFAQPDSPRAPRLAARAVLADPALLASIDFEARPDLLAAALAEVARWEGIDTGLRKAIVDVAASLPSPGHGPDRPPRRGHGRGGDDRHLAQCLPPPAVAAEPRLRRGAAARSAHALRPRRRRLAAAARVAAPCRSPAPRRRSGRR